MSMQIPVNLVELWSIFEAENEVMESWLKIHDFGYNFERDRLKIDTRELLSYKGLISQLSGLKWDQAAGFYLGVQLNNNADTQFDLLKPLDDEIINIEFKEQEPEKDTLSQAVDHYRFLKMQYSKVWVYSYRNDLNVLYRFEPATKTLVAVTNDDLVTNIPKGTDTVAPLLEMEPSDFLVSPYTQPEKFMNSFYELSGKQERVKATILSNLKGIHVIKGGPGAGKSLVIIDIIKELVNSGLKVALIMGAKPGNGQKRLAELLGFELFWYYNIGDLSQLGEFDAFVFDKSQRITQGVIDAALAMPADTLRIFSIDQNQVVHPDEANRNVESQLDEVKTASVTKLPNSVRSKPEFISFIKKMFNLHAKHAALLDYPSVKLTYFRPEQNYKGYLKMQKELFGVTVLEPDVFRSHFFNRTTGNKKIAESTNVKDVIGQEFENVLIVLDDKVNYDDNGILQYNIEGYPYDAIKMLYQAITRATKTIEIVVTANKELYITLQQLLTSNRDRYKEKEDKMAALVLENKQLAKENLDMKEQLAKQID